MELFLPLTKIITSCCPRKLSQPWLTSRYLPAGGVVHLEGIAGMICRNLLHVQPDDLCNHLVLHLALGCLGEEEDRPGEVYPAQVPLAGDKYAPGTCGAHQPDNLGMTLLAVDHYLALSPWRETSATFLIFSCIERTIGQVASIIVILFSCAFSYVEGGSP